MIAWSVCLVIWGFIAPRFMTGSQAAMREAA